MTWPQIIVMLWLVLRCIFSVRSVVTNKNWTSGIVTFGVLLEIGIGVGLTYVLHAGGFW